MSKKQNSFWRLLLLTLTGLALGLSIYNWNARTVLGNQMPMPFGYGFSVVLSGSMEPALSVNDLVVIREGKQAEEGDIIVFQSGNSLVIHRVLEIDGDSLITKGDANNAADAAIAMSDVKGVMVTRIPGLGALILLLRKPLVLLILLGLAVALTELSYQREKARDQQELDAIQQEIRQLLNEVKEET